MCLFNERTVLALFVLFTVFACSNEKPVQQEIKTVKTTFVQTYCDAQTLVYPGRIKAYDETNMSFKVAGRLKKVHVKRGDYVKKGALLAELDDNDYRWQFEATNAEYTQIKAEAERVIELYNRKSASRSDYDKAVAGLQRISSLYQVHKEALADTRLIAPYEGYVTQTFTNQNELLNKGIPVLHLSSANRLCVEVNLPAVDYIKSDRFVSYEGEVNINPGVWLPLQPEEIGKDANLNQLFPIKLALKDNARKNIAPGMSMSVRIHLQGSDTCALQIPFTALFHKDGNSCVWKINNNSNTIEARQVKVSRILRNGIAVVQGNIAASDEIVTAGVSVLKEGESIKRLPEPSNSNIGGLL
ncbi:MAG: efflux RND transporter periplasmic adaptor subunit [Marinifilaceae bacterium]